MDIHGRMHPRFLAKIYPFILWVIRKQRTHGYGLIKILQKGGLAAASPGRLYPLLNQMMKEGLITQTEERQGKRIRKVYALTPAGRKQIQEGKRLFTGIIREYLREMIR